MANLIKRIAISNSGYPGMSRAADEYKTHSTLSSKPDTLVSHHGNVELNNVPDRTASVYDRVIKATTEYTVKNEPFPNGGRRPSESEVQIIGGCKNRYSVIPHPTLIVEEAETKSIDSLTEVAESLQTPGTSVKRADDSDDEAVLVEKRGRW